MLAFIGLLLDEFCGCQVESNMVMCDVRAKETRRTQLSVSKDIEGMST